MSLWRGRGSTSLRSRTKHLFFNSTFMLEFVVGKKWCKLRKKRRRNLSVFVHLLIGELVPKNLTDWDLVKHFPTQAWGGGWKNIRNVIFIQIQKMSMHLGFGWDVLWPKTAFFWRKQHNVARKIFVAGWQKSASQFPPPQKSIFQRTTQSSIDEITRIWKEWHFPK